MKLAVALSALLLGLPISSSALANCIQQESKEEEMVGKTGWLILNETQQKYLNFSDTPDFVIPALKQTGPEKWSPIEGEVYPQATRGTITSGIRNKEGYIRYFNFKIDGGKDIVIDEENVLDFNFTTCTAATILRQNDKPSYGRVKSIPMVPVENAKAVALDGNWIEQTHIDQVAFFNCNDYGNALAPSGGPYVMCDPVWKDGVEISVHTMPMTFYYENRDLVQITKKPES